MGKEGKRDVAHVDDFGCAKFSVVAAIDDLLQAGEEGKVVLGKNNLAINVSEQFAVIIAISCSDNVLDRRM